MSVVGASIFRRTYPCGEHMAREDMQALPGAPNIVYFIGCGSGHIKIGLTSDTQKRLWKLQQGNPLKLTLLSQRRGSRQIEEYLHTFYRKEHVRGEWFRASRRLKAFIGKLEAEAREYLRALPT